MLLQKVIRYNVTCPQYVIPAKAVIQALRLLLPEQVRDRLGE